jgi:hypothetical protein
VRINRKILALAAVATGSLLVAGCAGITAAGTISPLDFLLPGIIRTDPPQTNAPVVLVRSPVEIASVK